MRLTVQVCADASFNATCTCIAGGIFIVEIESWSGRPPLPADCMTNAVCAAHLSMQRSFEEAEPLKGTTWHHR